MHLPVNGQLARGDGAWVSLARLLGRPVLRTYRNAQLALLGKTPRWCRVAGEFAMMIDPSDWMDRAFYLGLYETHLVRFIRDHVRPGDVCVDVGAHKGYVALHLAHAVGPEGKVIAIEPDPRAAEQLKSNIFHNRLQNVLVYECAAADQAGTCEFTLSSQTGWSSRFMNELARPTAMATVGVGMATVDQILEWAGIRPERHRLSFVKIDTEGSEPLVLQGAQETLKRFRPTVHIEVNKSSLCAGGFSADSIESLLRPLDYQLYAIRCRRTAWVQRRLSLVPLTSLTSDIGDCKDVLAVSSPSCSGGPTSCLRGSWD